VNIVYVIPSVNPTGGGPIEGVKQMASVMQRNGHHVEVVSLDAPGAPFLKTFPLPLHPLGPGVMTYAYSKRLIPWLRENVTNYDVVIVNGVWQYNGFGVWRVLHGAQTPYVVFTHGMLDPWFQTTYPLKHLKKMLYWRWGTYRLLRDARAVLFTCEEERVLAGQSFRPYRCNEIVVKYGTADPKGNPHTELEAFYRLYPQLREKRIALFLGRLHEKKGCDLLIQAFAKVLAKDPNWQLVLCGPDQVGWQAKLNSIAEHLNIANRITWPGMLSGELKWGALRASEVFVLPSHQENFGIVVAEALACGVPALISNKVNIWREVQGDKAGIVGSDDLEGCCDILQTWLNMSGQQRSDMRDRARQCFQQRFEIQEAAKYLVDTLATLTGRDMVNAHA
jgi:glycosyltransferase involved in cell wall biosynthesis